MSILKQKQTSPSEQCIATTCPYCGVGCGIDVNVAQGRAVKLEGSVDHPANFGRLCVKGTNLLATNDHSGRLLHPVVDGEQASWPKAITTVADKFNQIIKQHGPEAVAFYVSGQLLTEDYYVANKLIKGYIGSANIDTNSRLCMSAAVAGYKRAFGEDLVPCSYEDLEQTELLILTGSNAAWTHPVLFQRIERAKRLNPLMKVVVVDPRRTASAELADLHLAIEAGTDTALYHGLLHYLESHDGIDHQYVSAHTNNFAACLASAAPWTVAVTATFCGVSESMLTAFYQAFLQAPSAISFYCMGINQSSAGADKCNAIINAHLATGKIGKPGSGPFSITGQPNAMGGREVGGLANMLAAHLDIEDSEHRALVQSFWQSPTIAKKPGYKAVDLFDKIASGQVKAVWIMATNPVVSMPNRAKIEQALKQCEFVVVSDCAQSNDTLSFADVKLPATSWSEKDGTVTNSERRISRQRGMLEAPGQAKHDWQIICELAQAMGHEQGFDFSHPGEIFDEHARLTAFKNNGSRALDLSGLVDLGRAGYDKLKPVQWPVNQANPNGCQQVLANGHYYTQNAKANFIALQPSLPKLSTSLDYPLVLNTGRMRDQWHSMTRTGKTHVLAAHSAQPEVTMHPATAEKLAIESGDMVRVTSATGQISVQANVSTDVSKRQVFVPIHWSKQFASSASVALLFDSIVDSVSGQPELKSSPVSCEKIEIEQYALIHSPTDIDALATQLPQGCHWVKYQGESSVIYSIKCEEEQADLISKVKALLNQALDQHFAVNFDQDSASQAAEPGGSAMDNVWLTYANATSSQLSALRDNRFVALAFFSAKALVIDESWVNEILQQAQTSDEQINAVLHSKVKQNRGRKICSCFCVYEKDIIDAITLEGVDSVEGLGNQLKCGSNCGSCKSELSSMLREHLVEANAAEHFAGHSAGHSAGQSEQVLDYSLAKEVAA